MDIIYFLQSSRNALKRLGKIKYPIFPNLISYVACLLVIGGLSYVRTSLDMFSDEKRKFRSFFDNSCLSEPADFPEVSQIIEGLGIEERDECPRFGEYLVEMIRPVRAEMNEVVFTKKSTGWKGLNLAKQEFRLRWCKQLGNEACKINAFDENVQFDLKEEIKFRKAWKRQWRILFTTFSKPDLRKKRLERANLRFTQLEGVRLDQAKLQGADLRHANMSGAILILADMRDSDLTMTKLQDANLSKVQLQGAYLLGAQLHNANLSEANLQKSDFTAAKLIGTDLSSAKMQDAQLILTHMQGTPEQVMRLDTANLSDVLLFGSALRYIDFTGATVFGINDYSNNFGDGSVNLAGKLKKPDGWCTTTLSDEQYWGRYLGWLKKYGMLAFTTPEFVTSYPEIPFGTPCPDSHHPE